MSCEVKFRAGRVCLSGELTIYDAPKTKERLLVQLKRRRAKGCLDLSAVSEIDTAGIQLLLMAKRMCDASAGRFGIIDPTPAVREALSLCGLSGLIDGCGARP